MTMRRSSRGGPLDGRGRVLVAAVAAILGAGWPTLASAAPAPAAGSLRIAVVEFTNATTDKELESLGKGLQSMVATDLAQVPGLRLVERERLKDVFAELKLGRGGQIDKSTAARIGKLAGATHLLGGTFTVVAARMRIDARLFSVENGEVVVAEQIEGERDAFFELEKTLGQKVIDSLGIKLQPRERAVLAKVHTADFEAFRSFSKGLAAFDDKRYQDAVTALGDATHRDKDFQLAARTLEDYQRLIGEIRQKAQALDTAAESDADRKARAEQAKQSARWGATIEQLWKLASTAGGGQAQADRIAAIFLLSQGYRHRFQLRWPRGDQFALDRTADDLDRRYVAEAAPLFPRIPPVPVSDAWDEPPKDKSVTDWIHATYAAFEGLMVGQRRRRVVEELGRQINKCQNPHVDSDALVNALLLDGEQTLRFAERMDRWRDALAESDRYKANDRTFFAGLYRQGLELERSTALWAEQSRADKDAYAMRKDAAEIETNRHLLELLQTSKNPGLVREVMLGYGPTNAEEVIKRYLMTPSLAPEGYRALLDVRHSFPGFILMGDVPLWLIHAGHSSEISTGPRTDRRRTSEIRYWPDAIDRKFNGRDPPSMLLLAEGKPRTDLRARFTVRVAMPEDFRQGVAAHLASAKANHIASAEDPPEVGFAFGIQQARGDDKMPTTGYALVFDRRSARLGRFVVDKSNDPQKGRGGGKDLQLTVLEEHPLPLPKASPLDIAVLLKGQTLEVTVSGHKVAFRAPAPAERSGFPGVVFRDFGYASLGDLKLGAP